MVVVILAPSGILRQFLFQAMEKTQIIERVGDTLQSAPITAHEAVIHIKAQTGNPDKFKIRKRGYVDWKFGELSEYQGYTRARQYIESVRRWHDFREKYSDCLLETTYSAFLAAESLTV